MNKRSIWLGLAALGLGAWVCTACVSTATAPDTIEWPNYGGDLSFHRYSPANLINPRNVKGLKILWVRPGVDESLRKRFPGIAAGRYFRPTPIMIDGVLYSPNGIGLVEAFDALTGKTIWVQQPFSSDVSEVAGNSTRGAAYWRSGETRRIISIRGPYLYSLDAKTGAVDPAFGEGGRVSLMRPGGVRFSVSGGPLVAGDLVIVGGMGGKPGDYGTRPEGVPEDVRAYDVRTGRQVWAFSPRPAEGDPARATWGNGSAELAGSMGSYGTFSFDPELGYVYIAFSAPNPPLYGGWRPGDNLYGTSLVAVDVHTGKKVWHQQLVRHDVWDFDLAAPPVLGDIVVDGRPIKAVMQTGKVPLLFTFDRATGKPVWPIIDTPVPPSKVPGEHLSPTQPIPSKPAPLDRVGVHEEDLIDFTPELHREALEIFYRYTSGPLYSPPSIFEEGRNRGTLALPGTDGGGNWNTGAFDPETHTYYGATITVISNHALVPTTEPGEIGYKFRVNEEAWTVPGPRGLYLAKPPYGRITAVDMNTGDFRWVTPLGDGPRDDPALKHLNLPRLGIPARAGIAVTKSLVFAGQSSDAVNMAARQHGYGSKFQAFDKKTGELLTEVELPPGAGTTASPMTYVVNGKQMVVVAVGSSKAEPAWVAFGL